MKRAIAFYLPQFHPIPENDEWWGKGFTEWRNVSRGTPQFEGHLQPNLPGELGHYDLRVREVQLQQIELAKAYGLYGFCFYYYWFDGKRLLEYPLDRFASDPEMDFPFCICWANETWSRRWDGSESEVLVKQTYSAQHAERLFEDFAVYLENQKYIEIDGRKVILVYRPDDIPDVRQYVDIWRDMAKGRGWTLLVAACLTFGGADPTRFGFDAAVQFPPHGVPADEVTGERVTVRNFGGKIHSYSSVVANQIADPAPSFPLFRGVMPSWDNTARRLEQAHIYDGHSPELFSIWLSDAFQKTFSDARGHQYVFINAWNEWAEGAYIEPDERNGSARLEALKFAVEGGGRSDMALGALDKLAELVAGTPSEIIGRSANILRESIAASNRLLGELRSLVLRERSQYELFSPLLPTPRLLLGSDRALFLPGALGTFDRIGSSSFENGIQIRAGRTLYISGWVLPPEPELISGRTHVVVTLAAPNGTTLYYESDQIRDRPDVADHLAEWPRESASQSGFELNLSVEDLSEGIYVASVGVSCGDYIYLLRQPRTFVVAREEFQHKVARSGRQHVAAA